MFPFLIYPILPTDYDLPPTIYSLLNSIVNFGKEDKTKIKNLASLGRNVIFDFDYPLTNKISKEEFEVMILNKFMMRRIGYDTLTAFQIALNVKLNEIMPIYNKLFDALDGWDILNDGEKITRETNEQTTNNLDNTTNNNDITDLRYSKTPQNELTDIQDGKYVTDYNYNQSNGESHSESNGSGSSNVNETIERTPSDKIAVYQKFIENRTSIYSMIFKELDTLFYQLT